MPLKSGYSRATVDANIAQLLRENVPRANALAAAYEHARKSYFKRYPQGALPKWLAYPDGSRLCKTCSPRRKNPALGQKVVEQVAAQLVTIVRRHGKTAGDRAYSDAVIKYNLTAADEARILEAYARAMQAPDIWGHVEHDRGKNPVPESSRSTKRSREARITAAQQLYTAFTGHEADELVSIDKPEFPDVLSVIGDIDGVLYTTVRDGKTEKYIHKFKKDCRPLFCVSHDGKQLFMLGGSYDFTERGIVDRS